MADYPTFDDGKVQSALAAAAAHNDSEGLKANPQQPNLAGGGELSVLAECISVTVENHQICINLPLGIGSVCLPVPDFVPSGTAAEVCLSICTTFGIPTGVKVTVSIAARVIITKSFGKC